MNFIHNVGGELNQGEYSAVNNEEARLLDLSVTT